MSYLLKVRVHVCKVLDYFGVHACSTGLRSATFVPHAYCTY